MRQNESWRICKESKENGQGGQALNNARGYAKPQTGGDNVAKQIYGIPNAGTTGPNRTATYDYKKGGSIKKYPDGGSTKESKKKEAASNESKKKDPAINSAAYNKLFNSTQARDSANFYRAALKKEILTKGHSDKTTKLGNDLQRQFNKGKKGYDKLGNPKGKFGMSVPVKASCKNGMVRSADGKCVMERPKFKSGGPLKPVNKSANPGLAKLPTAVRNKMGFQRKGGSIKR